MLNEMKYGALSGKTRAMYGKLLKNEDYTSLMQKKSVGEVVSYLKDNTHYRSVLSEAGEESVHRGRLENLLKHDLINDYSKLLKFANGHTKEFINLLYMKIEIENLKLLFRLFEAGHTDRIDGEDLRFFLSGRNRGNIQKLALSRSFNEFLSGLEGSVYYDVLKPFAQDSNAKRLFDIEMALDQLYLRNVQNKYKKLLKGPNLAIMGEFAGLESDMFNIFWIYRSKAFYRIDHEVIGSYILPPIYRLNKKTIEGLIKANSVEEYIRIMKGTFYGFLFEGRHELLFEHNYSEFMYRVHKMRFRRHPFSISCVTSYLRMKEFELSNIITIIEGIRYGLSEENIRKYLVGINIK